MKLGHITGKNHNSKYHFQVIWTVLTYGTRRYDSAICCSKMSKNGHVVAANSFLLSNSTLPRCYHQHLYNLKWPRTQTSK